MRIHQFLVQGPMCPRQRCGDWTHWALGVDWGSGSRVRSQSRGHWNCPERTIPIRDFCLMIFKAIFPTLFSGKKR